MITIDSKSLDHIIEVWNIRLDGIFRDRGVFGTHMGEVNYEVHTTIQHNPPDGQRTISQIFPESGEVTDEIRKVLETEVQKIDH